MVYRSTRDCVDDLERHGMIVRIKEEVDPNLEMAEIQRQVYRKQNSPAVLFEKVKGSPFPAVSNLFGSKERTDFIFRRSLRRTRAAVALKADPTEALRHFWRYIDAPLTGIMSLPKRVHNMPVMAGVTTLDQLPQIVSWPRDGGPFITLPQVLSMDPARPGIMRTNIGMYRVQMAGNQYVQNKEVGLHYQIHRGIGIHHAEARKKNEPLKVAIFVGGPPAHTVAAVMPLPEGLSEVVFAGMLAGRRFRYGWWQGWIVAAEADFCILGTVDPTATKPEGPFGDHLGYYSMQHDFPVMTVDKVFHRKDAIWPFTVVGRPPQEDTSFGALIHEITKPMVPVSLPGVKAIHAVDAAGVHPLLLAIGSERYRPYVPTRRPAEILTQSHAILGFNQASLAKYLMIVAREDDESLEVSDVKKFFQHLLERVDWTRDLHFQTKTTMDTLDYSGDGLNEGSKVVITAVGPKRRQLQISLPDDESLVGSFDLHISHPLLFGPRLLQPGILVIGGPPFRNYDDSVVELESICRTIKIPESIPLVVLVDDPDFVCRDFSNWLWVTFTRSQPSRDIYGLESFVEFKHWGCRSALVIDARLKPHHAPPLVEEPKVSKSIQEKISKMKW